MSPSENDLRAALRDGEDDDRPDVDRVLAEARSRRGQRRARVLGVAAAVVLVAAAAVGTAVLRGSNDSGQQSAGPAGTVQSAAGSSAAAIGAVCPSTYPTRSVAALGAGSGPMFSSPIASALICSYDESGSAPAHAGSQVLVTGADATTLATSIDQASTSRLKIMCPDIVAADKKLIAIVGVTADGTILPTVTTDVSVPNCNEPITNGTAVRYAWKPPASLAAKIAALP